MHTITIPGLSGPGTWDIDPVAADFAEGVLSITAPGGTDLFTDPMGSALKDDAPRLAFPADAQFTLSACVSVDVFASTFDAGVLVVWADALRWGKLCFERSPQGQPMVVSVVTNSVSDDCNHVPVMQDHVYMRISRLDPAIALHYSLDGRLWHMVRHFALSGAKTFAVGFSAQSPTGDGATARFSEIRYTAEPIGDLRSGV
jgi:regulation of enolase protein 1 (concanavalin A-like superfamily)